MVNLSSFYYVSILIVLAIAFFLGSYALELAGVQYVSEGGPALYKIHLYSYVSLGLFVVYLLNTSPSKIRRELNVFFKPWLYLFFSIIYLIVYGLIKFGMSGMAYVVDTLLVPILIFPILFRINVVQSRLIAKFIFILLAVNSFAAIYEYVQGTQIFSFEYEEHWIYFRSTAFLSHPLNNALIVSFLAIFLYKFKFINPVILFLIVSLGLFCFGARTATLIFVLLSVFELAKFYRQRYKSRQGLGFVEFLVLQMAMFFSVAILFYAVFYLNFGQRIFENIAFDGSARSRFDVFNVFNYLSFNEYLFGVKPEFIENIMFYIDNAVVENFVIGWFLLYGFIGCFFLIFFFYRFMFALFSYSSRAEKVAIVCFLIVSISNNSLSSKTPALLFLFVAFVVSLKVKEDIFQKQYFNI